MESQKPQPQAQTPAQKRTLQKPSDLRLPPLLSPYAPTLPMSPYYLPYNPCYYAPLPRNQSEVYQDQPDRPRRGKDTKPGNRRTSIYDDNRKYRRRFDFEKKARLRRIMVKVFRAVAYVFILRDLCQAIRKKKKQLFDVFWPAEFKKQSPKIRKLL